MTETSKPTIVGLCHVGLHTKDPAQMATFYRDVIGLQIVSRVEDPLARMVFLSSRPDEEAHELVFISNPELAHIAFKVKTLADLRAFYQQVVARGLPIKMAYDHGASLAFYFHDPEGHLIEIYWPTDLASKQTESYPIDLTMPEATLLASMVERQNQNRGNQLCITKREDSMSASVKQKVQQIYDAINANALDDLDALFAANLLDHRPSPDAVPGLAGTKQTLRLYHAVFSNLEVTAEDMIADGDKVVVRLALHGIHSGEFMGLPPTGREVTMNGIEIFRLANGQIVERWAEFDMLSLMQQLGAMG